MKRAATCREGDIVARQRRAISAQARRRILFETLEERTVFAPFGAFPDDTGEYMLGDVLVTVVLMESDQTLPGADVSTENWTAATINAVQQKVQDGMNWWKQTLASTPGIYYNPDLPLLDFKYDWTWALDPVETGYEPINRYSSQHPLWIQDFLMRPDVNFDQSGDVYRDVKAFNNFQRERYHTDWAFTIFVVNSTNDNATDGENEFGYFPLNPSPAPGEVNYRGAFAFLGGQFLVVPSERPNITFAHETGHIFYALDEYSSGHSYYAKSGYYNTQNTNSARDNPAANFLATQQPSIMATATAQNTAWANNVTSTSSSSAVGWQDSDQDGVMDVLDVPFSLKGVGTFNPSAGTYRFKGTSHVQTLKNTNTFGGQNTNVVYNDITINKIRKAEYKLDDGPWTTIATYNSPNYQQDLDLTIPGITVSAHTLRIRTFDTRTGAKSEEFVATINPSGQPTPPQYAGGSTSSVSGFVFSDANANGLWDFGEQSLSNWALQLLNIDNQPLNLQQTVEPSDYAENTQLNAMVPGISLSVVGATATSNMVLARTSTLGAGRIFTAGSTETFATIRTPGTYGTSLQTDRRLRIEFASPVTTVSLKAISASLGSGKSVARLLAYDADNNLIDRYTTGALGQGQSETMTISLSTANIKYVVAMGHLETEVMFDTLVVGPKTGTTTSADGSFTLNSLPAGTYTMNIAAAPNYAAISPANDRITFTVPISGGNQYFAYQYTGNPWRNATNPLDVNGAGGVTAFDALMIINFLNLHPNSPLLVGSEAQPNYWLDVNDDNRVSAFDVLPIINYLNTNPIGSGPEQTDPEFEPEGQGLVGNGNGGGGGGGESVLLAPQTADEYFASGPLHVSQVEKDEPHNHAHDDGDDHFADLASDWHHDHDDDLADQSTQARDDLFTLPSLSDDVLFDRDALDDGDGRLSLRSQLFSHHSDLLPLLTRLERVRTEEVEEGSLRLRRLLALRSRHSALDGSLTQTGDATTDSLIDQRTPRRQA